MTSETVAPAVSVVVPVFNAARFLDTSIGSVLGQSRTDWELVLVDDGSRDDSRAICAAHAERDPRIRVIGQDNRGPAAARNLGMNQARGRFISFLDADDQLLPDALSFLLAEAEQRGAELVLGNFEKSQGGRRIAQPAVFRPNGSAFTGVATELTAADLLDYVRHFLWAPSNHLVSYCWARLYRRDVVQAHALKGPEDMQLFEDFAFNLDYMGKVKRLVFVNRPIYVYSIHDGHPSASMAILDARQLTHDMQIFRQKLDDFLAEIGVTGQAARQVAREAGHALVHYAIIFLVRTCRQIDAGNRADILAEIARFVASPVLRQALPCYRPRPGDSRLVPWLMTLKLTGLLAAVCRWKGERRYGRIAEAGR